MRQRLLEGTKVILALVLVVVLGWGVYALLVAGVKWLASVQSDVATAVVAAAATIAVAFITLTVRNQFERHEAIKRDLRLKKVPAYEQLIASIFTFFQQGKPGYPKAGEAPSIREQTDLIQNIILWASDPVLKQFGEFRVAILKFKESDNDRSPLLAMENLMLAIRKDLGYKNDNIIPGDILRLFINDFAEYQATRGNRKT